MNVRKNRYEPRAVLKNSSHPKFQHPQVRRESDRAETGPYCLKELDRWVEIEEILEPPAIAWTTAGILEFR